MKADRLSLVRWKDIPHVHFTDRVKLAAYHCIEEDNFDCKLQVLPLLIVFFANSISGIFLKRRRSVFPTLFIGFVCRAIVVFCRCLFTCLWWLSHLPCPLLTASPSFMCLATFSLVRGFLVVVFHSVARAEFQVGVLAPEEYFRWKFPRRGFPVFW